MKAECRVPKSNRYDLHVIGQGHFIKKLHWVLSRPYLIYLFMYNHHTLHASTTWEGDVSRIITRSLWPTFHSLLHIKGKSCLAYNFHSI